MNDMNLFTPDRPPIPEEFNKLQEMEAFSEEMFNRIVAFQEKLHPGWNPALPFAERIRELPIHALVFSNPDRDPAESGPTVAAFYPLRDELRTIAMIAKQVAENPVVCDLHSGNGFVGSLLAREGLKVIGIRDPGQKPNQIADFHDPECYRFRDVAIDAIDFPFDIAFSAWMPGGANMTPQIVAFKPKLIVFVHTDHVDESSGRYQTGTPDAYKELPENYQCIAEWSITRPQDFLHEIWPELTPNIEETRHVKIFADHPYHDIDVSSELPAAEPYDWEYELDMSLTALQAKEHLRSQGFPV